jgi:small-conductance mechanosensitive channel
VLVVPNSKFADAIMTNYHHPQQDMAIILPIGVSYDSDLELVERVTAEVGTDVMTTVDGGLPRYFVWVAESDGRGSLPASIRQRVLIPR